MEIQNDYLRLLCACDGAVGECGVGGGFLVRREEVNPLCLDALDWLVKLIRNVDMLACCPSCHPEEPFGILLGHGPYLISQS